MLPRGGYHFFHATARADGTRAQADHFIRTLTVATHDAELPPMVDVESLPAGVTAAQAVASLQFFLSIVEQGLGRRPQAQPSIRWRLMSS
ncbi:GH25 family lysozyme [Corallococcus sp. CA053C]|uniref:GH25 family lysozyme n=1 Tax=Corallococcus sp. CA053C TaxID=2316732 RepID=UPI0034CEDF1C